MAMLNNQMVYSVYIDSLVGGLEHGFYDFPHHIWNFIIPTDFHIFQRGRSTTKQYIFGIMEIFHGNIYNDFTRTVKYLHFISQGLGSQQLGRIESYI